MESLGEWLDREVETVPQELAARIRAALPAEWRSTSRAGGSTVLVEAAATELRGLLERGCEARWAAPGLLTVDALVTYACELLATGGGDIDAGTADILDRVTRALPQPGSAA
jgi:hypothetical protein